MVTEDVTVQDVKDRLIGLSPYLEQAEDVERIISDNIQAATDRFERELEAHVSGKVVIKMRPHSGLVKGVDYDIEEPALDWTQHKLRTLPVFMMRRRPIISVERVSMEFEEDLQILDVPQSWLRIQKNLGIVKLLPIATAAAMLTMEGIPFLPMLSRGWPWEIVPQFICVDYTAGYEHPTQEADLRDLRRHLAAQAALYTFEDIQDNVVSSVSMDGINQSFDAVEQRLKRRAERVEQFLDEWKKRYRPPRMLII